MNHPEKTHRAQSPPGASPPYNYTYDNDDASTENLLRPQPSEPGLASSSMLTRGLQVPSRTSATTSGFPYPEELSSHKITKEKWAEFTTKICDEAKLSRDQWKAVIGKGLGTLALGGVMIGFLGAVPAIFVAKNARRRQEQRNLISSMAGARGKELARHIAHWNNTFFQPRGLLIRVDLPDEYLQDMENMNLHPEAIKKGDAKGREKAALKARIVIIPTEAVRVDSDSSFRGKINGRSEGFENEAY
ncbi:hypothetical protein N7532_001051 [Penicillium argentinense]|uniref:Uncharacterized protein n=1 Tax=Penicillium argentinense TaxID=1131581 RepID=A0A9W9G1R7_9EURO|nr:uncharacterized protein N7532_001051 [Penicillium argentinense]KAJ5110516.1 hypothetical protein N7532_001051 [Penicillium argentinense]